MSADDATVVAFTRRPGKRTAVPAPDVTGGPSAALDELTGETAVTVQLDVALLRAHPSNPRRDLGDLTELIDSIRAHGVRQNLLVVPDPDEPDHYRIVIGHRRAAAARDAGVRMLTAVLDPTLTPADQLELMLLENIQRQDLTPDEEADAYQGLLDLGLDEKAIATRTGRSRSTVAARLALRGLPAAARVKIHAHQATLADAALLADAIARPEIATRPLVVEKLTAALGDYGFAHTISRALEDATEDIKHQAVVDELTAAGVTVVRAPRYEDRDPAPLGSLTTDGKPLTVKTHASCPGAVAWVAREWRSGEYLPTAVHGCNGWKRYHKSTRGAPAAGQPDPAERRLLIENNKAALAAATVRNAWIRDELLTRKKMPADAAVYVANLVQPGEATDWQEAADFDRLLYGGYPNPAASADVKNTNPDRAMVLLVALAVVRTEKQMGKDFWRSPRFSHGVHLRMLASWGYELSDVERLVVDATAGED